MMDEILFLHCMLHVTAGHVAEYESVSGCRGAFSEAHPMESLFEAAATGADIWVSWESAHGIYEDALIYGESFEEIKR